MMFMPMGKNGDPDTEKAAYLYPLSLKPELEDPSSWNHLETCSFLCLALELIHQKVGTITFGTSACVLFMWLKPHSMTAVSPKGTPKTIHCKSKHSRENQVEAPQPLRPSLRRHMLSLPSVSTPAKLSIHRKVNTTYQRKSFKEFANLIYAIVPILYCRLNKLITAFDTSQNHCSKVFLQLERVSQSLLLEV